MDQPTTAERTGRGYVLVVDDDPHIVSFILEVLEDEGYEAEMAPNGKAALEAIERRSRNYAAGGTSPACVSRWRSSCAPAFRRPWWPFSDSG